MSNETRSSFPRTRIPWVSVLCALLRGTASLQEHILELFRTGQLKGSSRVLIEDVARGTLGFPMVQQFERLQILFYQPVAIHLALAKGEEEKAKEMQDRLDRWRVQFEELYGEPPTKRVNLGVLKRHTDRLCKLSRN